MSVNLSERDNVAILTIDRPESLNALSFAILHRIGELLDEVARSRARALIVIGAGEKAPISRNCAGAR